MAMKNSASVIVGILIVAAVAGGGYFLQKRAVPNTCRICQRELHPEARVVMEVDGQRQAVCCTHCVLTQARQIGKSIRLVEVTDYVSRRPLRPENAFYVEDSKLVLCDLHKPFVNESKQPYDRVFDRCVPGIYAFARREDAEAFARDNGGTVRNWSRLIEEVQPRP